MSCIKTAVNSLIKLDMRHRKHLKQIIGMTYSKIIRNKRCEVTHSESVSFLHSGECLVVFILAIYLIRTYLIAWFTIFRAYGTQNGKPCYSYSNRVVRVLNSVTVHTDLLGQPAAGSRYYLVYQNVSDALGDHE